MSTVTVFIPFPCINAVGPLFFFFFLYFLWNFKLTNVFSSMHSVSLSVKRLRPTFFFFFNPSSGTPEHRVV